MTPSQFGEDDIVRSLFPEGFKGRYIDVGAGDPVVDSVTETLYRDGWRGVNIEPGPEFWRLVEARPEDVNVQAAVSATEGLVFFDVHPTRGWSGIAPAVTNVVVGLTTLARTLQQFGRADFIKVDVEGAEFAVLVGMDWSLRPSVWCIEAVDRNTAQPAIEWEPMLLDHGYQLVHGDGVNRFYQ